MLGTVVGLLMVVAVLALARWLGALQRLLLWRGTGDRVTAPAPFQPGTGVLGRLDRRLRDRDGWRAVGYAELKLPVAIARGGPSPRSASAWSTSPTRWCGCCSATTRRAPG